jgi:hypothetical protein
MENGAVRLTLELVAAAHCLAALVVAIERGELVASSFELGCLRGALAVLETLTP